MLIDDVFLRSLLEQASESDRLRKNYDLRTSDGDSSQRMLNALQPGTRVPIHRHCKTSETVVLIKGHITEVFFDEEGVECARHDMDVLCGTTVLQIPKGMWHTLIVHEPSVIFEAKDGCYEPLSAADVRR